MYSAPKAGDWDTLSKMANKPSENLRKLGGSAASGIMGTPGAQPNWLTNETKGSPLTTQDKWPRQKVQCAQALIDAKGNATNLTAKVDAITGPADLSRYKKMGAVSAAAIRLARTSRGGRSATIAPISRPS